MRNLLIVVAITIVFLATASRAPAAEPARGVDDSKLAAMGLPKMRAMSDREGWNVRGKGSFARAFGPTYNQIHLHLAAGSNSSLSLVSLQPFVLGVSGGGSIAVAK
jgi:hypothetical protein